MDGRTDTPPLHFKHGINFIILSKIASDSKCSPKRTDARTDEIIHAPLNLKAETLKCRARMRVDVNYCHLSLLITSFYAF